MNLRNRDGLIWGYLIHLSYNMWVDSDRFADKLRAPHLTVKPTLRCESGLWDELVRRMASAGINMLVIDLGDAVRWESHPEIAVNRAWSPARLRRELAKIRKLGIEPIPKLNFSAAHDIWLSPYDRMVSTDRYYGVCKDLIAEAIALFDRPRFFHLGMDEERPKGGRYMQYVVLRQFDLWWHDLYFLLEQVERGGVRPWVWSDYVWDHPEEFFRKMPKSVLQSNWYYHTFFGKKHPYVKAYLDLEAHRYDQVPTASVAAKEPENLARTVAFCRRHIPPKRLWGFLQTIWRPTLRDCRAQHIEAIDLLESAITKWKNT